MGRKIACAMLCAGIFLLIFAYLAGDVEAGLFVIFPFIYGSGPLAFAGVLLIVISLLIFMVSLIPHEATVAPPDEPRVEKKTGGILLIGPIPVIFATDTDMAKLLVAIALGMMVLMVVLGLFLLS